MSLAATTSLVAAVTDPATAAAAPRHAPSPARRQADFWHDIEVDDAGDLSDQILAGVDPNLRDAHGQVALYVALRDGSPRCVRLLATTPGLQVDAANAAGETPLMMAALRRDEGTVRLLLSRGASPVRAGWSPLHYAAAGGDPALVRLFLSLGAPVDARAPDGSTPLAMAARYGGSDAAEVLLEAGADRGLKDARGRDPAGEADAAGLDAVAAWLRSWHRPAPARVPASR